MGFQQRESSFRLDRAARLVRPSVRSSAPLRSDAEQRAQVQEQLRRPALVARATAPGRAVDSQ